MATIMLSDAQPSIVTIDFSQDKILVEWIVKDPKDRVYSSGVFHFWKSMPVITEEQYVDGELVVDGEGEPILVEVPPPDNWLEIPSVAKGALTTIVNLVNDFIAAQDL